MIKFFFFGMLGLAIGYGVGFWQGNAAGTATKADYEKKVERIEEYFPPAAEMTSVSGVVKEIKGSILVIRSVMATGPLEQVPEFREVTVSKSTKIIGLVEKTPEAYAAEMREYRLRISQPAAPGAMPVMYPSRTGEGEIGLEDVNVGDSVVVEAAKDVRMDEKFEAVSIRVSPNIVPDATVVPAPPAP